MALIAAKNHSAIHTPHCDWTRRQMLLGGGAMLGAAGLGLSGAGEALAATGPRRFVLFRGKEEVGYHTLDAKKVDGGLQVDIRILIEVRRLGIRFYVYEHSNREVWRNGQLVSLNATTNDDGASEFCRVSRNGGRLQIAGSRFSGTAPAGAAPTSYWNYANFKSRTWFSTQSGRLLKLRFRKRQLGPLESWSVRGDFDTTLIYDNQQEWRGCRFDAKGAQIVYRQTGAGPNFQALV